MSEIKTIYGNTLADTVARSDLGEESVNLYGAKAVASNTINDVTFTLDESSITLNGTASASINQKFYFGGSLNSLSAEDGDTLTMSHEEVSGTYSGYVYLSLNGVQDTTIRIDQLDQRSFSKTSSMSCIQFWFSNGVVFNNLKINLQIEKGSVATPFCRYGGEIANDKVARADIETINGTLTEYNARISQNENTPLVTDKYTDWVVGTLNSSGLPQNATYRLRTVDYIPFSAVHKMTWDAGYRVIVAFYDTDFAYLGATSEINSGTITKTDLLAVYSNATYIKMLFANSDVSTITVDAIATAHFKLYTINSQNNTYEDFVENDLPTTWEVPYRDIMQMMGTGFSFAIQTDTHYSKELPCFYNALKNLSRRVGFDFIANLGDIIRGYEYDTVTDSYAEYEKAIKGLVDGSECSTFALMGNHDNGCMYATATGQISDAFLPAELYSLFERPTTTNDPAVVWGSREGLYFYRDFDRVRVIVLNTSDLPYEEVSASDINVNNLAISTEQVNWFTNTALNTDKPVLVLSHAPLDGTNTITNRTAIVSALESFVSGGGTVIANVAGHTHEINATKTNGINYIVCDNGSDRCEVFAVDLDNRTITTQQIGEDFTESRSFTF